MATPLQNVIDALERQIQFSEEWGSECRREGNADMATYYHGQAVAFKIAIAACRREAEMLVSLPQPTRSAKEILDEILGT